MSIWWTRAGLNRQHLGVDPSVITGSGPLI